jgi:hypothetical protein
LIKKDQLHYFLFPPIIKAFFRLFPNTSNFFLLESTFLLQAIKPVLLFHLSFKLINPINLIVFAHFIYYFSLYILGVHSKLNQPIIKTSLIGFSDFPAHKLNCFCRHLPFLAACLCYQLYQSILSPMFLSVLLLSQAFTVI